jgi:predicted transposase YdaD
VVRVWEQPVESVLACGLTVLPLAPVSRVEMKDVPGVLLAISKRLEREATPEQAVTLWGATRILMGLRYEQEQVDAIIQGVSAMLFGIEGIEESTVYQGILRRGEAKGRAEGRLEEDRTILLGLGREKLGPPDEQVEARIAAIADQAQLHRLLHGLLRASSWDELMGPPSR